MAFNLNEINMRARIDAKRFVDECDANYNAAIVNAASRIIENMKESSIVLLSGPSSSGKTTTAQKIDAELSRRGVKTHTISMDNYFKTITPDTAPRTPEGQYDLESPECLDMELLRRHFTELEEGKRIYVPKFEFATQSRSGEISASLKLGKNEIAIFEGIHALNDEITAYNPEAFKLYISARSNVTDGEKTVFKGTWMRLVRRTVRDFLFRASDAAFTLSNWANIRRGEKQHISPFKEKADLKLDTAHAYEVGVLKHTAKQLFHTIPDALDRYSELGAIIPALDLFEEIDPALLAPDSLIREFIGGGIYDR